MKAPVFSIFLLLLIIGGLASAGIITSQSTNGSVTSNVPKPSVPEFTLDLIDSSYETESTATIDPYTGQTVTQPSQHVEARAIVINIENTPFVSSQLQDKSNKTYNIGFFYNIRWKPHFAPEKDWLTLFGYSEYLPRSSAVQTIHQINMTLTWDGRIEVPTWSLYLPADSQLDFQVQAMIGGPNNAWSFLGEISGWSSTQTITVPAQWDQSSPSPTVDQTTEPALSQSPFQSNLNSENSGLSESSLVEASIIVLLSVIAVLLVIITVLLHKRKQVQNS